MLCSIFVNVLVVLIIELSTLSTKVFCLLSSVFCLPYTTFTIWHKEIRKRKDYIAIFSFRIAYLVYLR